MQAPPPQRSFGELSDEHRVAVRSSLNYYNQWSFSWFYF